jgi:DNA recombination protein RmuC
VAPVPTQAFAQFVLVFIFGFVIGALMIWLITRVRIRNEAQWPDKFRALAIETLNANHDVFLQLAESRLKLTQQSTVAELEKRTVAVDEMIKPVNEQLQKMDTHLQALEVSREGAYRELLEVTKFSHETSQQLRTHTDQLLQALHAPTARGNWGQMQLKRILQMSGMAVHARDFTEQQTLVTEEGTLKPDFIVALPGDRYIIFDSKVPLNAYLEHVTCTDASTKKSLLSQHAKQVREHIRKLGDKQYFQHIKASPGFVVLFMPGDHLLGAALESDPLLFDYGIAQKVVLAMPSTAIALLWSAAFGWSEQALTENAHKIRSLSGDLYSALISMTQHLIELGAKLEDNVKAYNKSVVALTAMYSLRHGAYVTTAQPRTGKCCQTEWRPLACNRANYQTKKPRPRKQSLLDREPIAFQLDTT